MSAWKAVGLAAVLLAGCASGPPPRPETYVVQPDDTLYSIAWRFDLNYRELAAWNDMGAASRLSPGQILLLRPLPGTPSGTPSGTPKGDPARTAARVPAPAPGAPPAGEQRRPMPRAEAPRVEKPRPLPDLPQRADSAPSGGATPPSATPPAAAAAPTREAAPLPERPLVWVWPTKALRRPAPVPGGGVLMLGGLGQDVFSAAAGKVVYVGAGIRGYGNLIIIKHSDSLLSAYAHNREVAVRESQQVRAGERIGAMGLGPRQIPALYFEIRLNGRPVDVFTYLKRQ